MSQDQPLIALNVIVRDDATRFENMLKTALPFVDEVVVAIDSRSEKDGLALKTALARLVPTSQRLCHFTFDWRDDFSYPRNLCLAKTTAQTMLWLDADDLLVEGESLREMAQTLLDTPEMPGWMVWYDYSHDTNDNPIHTFVRERLVRMGEPWCWKWVSRIHETLSSPLDLNGRPWQYAPKLRVLHTGNTQSRDERNTPLLMKQLRDSVPEAVWARGDMNEIVQATDDPRTLMYLGNAHFGVKERWADAVYFFRAFTAWPSYGPDRKIQPAERWISYRNLGELYQRQRRWPEAMTAYDQCEMLFPRWPDSWIGKADVLIALERYEDAELYHRQAMELLNSGNLPDPSIFPNYLDYKVAPCVQGAILNRQSGDYALSLKFCEMALKVQPDHWLLQELAHEMRVALRQGKEIRAAEILLEGLLRSDDPIRAHNIALDLPDYLKRAPRVQELTGMARGQISHVRSEEAYAAFYRDNPHWVEMPDDTLTDWRGLIRFSAMAGMIPDHSHVLDVGCSDGLIHPMLADKGCLISAIDLDPRCMKAVAERAQRLGYTDQLADLRVGMGEDLLEDLRAAGHRFDVVVLGEILEHVIDPQKLLRAAEKVADKVVLTTPREAFDSGELDYWESAEPRGHVRTFSRETLTELILDRGLAGRRVLELCELGGQAGHGWLAAAYNLQPATGQFITIFCGPGLERWSPITYREKGLGGSETAVIRVAAEMAAQGHHVRVVAEATGVFDGVHYLNWRDYPDLTSDLLIVWRNPEIVDALPADYPGQVALWVHDTDCGDLLTPERAERLSAVYYLSEWHREHLRERYPWLPEDALVRTWNGIDPLDVSDVERVPHRLMWASSPERGLDVLLENWPRIRTVWPDATLHAYYGWENIDRLIATGNYGYLKTFKEGLLPLLQQDGVHWHGRKDWKTLRRAWAASEVFLYPPPKTSFSETFCISVLEAQAAGCIPILHGGGALSETAGDGVVFGAVTSVEQALITMNRLDEDADLAAHVRADGYANAEAYTWRRVADQFLELITERVLVEA